MDRGLDTLKKSGFLCPFALLPTDYGLDDATFSAKYLCWFKAQNFLIQRGTHRVDPLFAECDKTLDYGDCIFYRTHAPDL